ncbi:MAG: hypothetical protein JO317_02210 [Verrucomicrobiae bacterium]|nr:hypothetical protein [Verrucomicrobiae bacterium]
MNFISALHGEKANQKISLAVADADLAEVIQQITTQAGIDHRIEPEGIIFENKIGSL